MKRYIYFLTCLLLMITGCKEGSVITQFPVDHTPPPKVTDVVVQNLEGKVKITYQLPNETDVLYVKAVYVNTVGETLEERASVFKNNLEIKGFGRTKKQTIQLITVDRSQNQSEPVLVEIEPLDSPIFQVYRSMDIQEAFGGIKLIWENPLNEQLIVKVYKKEDEEWIDIETFYSTETNAMRAVRGMDPVLQTFYIVIKDIYENATDTLITEKTPYYEIELPAMAEFKELPLSSRFAVSQYSIRWNCMWDGVVNSDQNMYYLALMEPQPYFTVDMARTYKLSRTKFWSRTLYMYALHNPRFFEIWGTNDWDAAKDPDNWEGWHLLLEGESYKPSGNPPGGDITEEDRNHALAGEEFEFPDDIPPVRYIRFKSIENWTKSSGIILAEWVLWGQEMQ